MDAILIFYIECQQIIFESTDISWTLPCIPYFLDLFTSFLGPHNKTVEENEEAIKEHKCLCLLVKAVEPTHAKATEQGLKKKISKSEAGR